jgi:hypothetical protein
MCAVLGIKTRILRPGRLVPFWRATGQAELIWAGFARKESLGWWKKRNAELVDIPADRFAERSDKDRQLRWDDMPEGCVVRGLIEPNEGRPMLKVVTRASSEEEILRFQHGRMPLTEPPLFNAQVIEPTPEAQAELF